MLCRDSQGNLTPAIGGRCPAGSTPIDEGTDVAAIVAGILQGAAGGPRRADGQYVPYQADTRPTTVQSFSRDMPGGGRPMGSPGPSVYDRLQQFKTLRLKDPAGYRKIVNDMRRAGLIGDRVTSDTTIAETYQTVLQASADLLEQGVMKTPDVLIDELASGGGALQTGVGGRAGAGAFSGPTSTVDLSNETTAYTLLNTAARDMIGRDLTPEEVRKYTEQLNQIERESPRVATPGGPGMTTYSGGVDRQEVVRQLIAENPEFAGFQLNHTIMDAMLADIDEGQAFLREWS